MSRQGGSPLLAGPRQTMVSAAWLITGNLGLCSGSGVGVAIHVEQTRRVHRRIDLGGRQARMAEQFLQRAKIGATRQQMSREAVPQRVRRERFRQAEAPPC